MNLILLITSRILIRIFGPWLLFINMVRALFAGEFLKYCRQVALADDRHSNVLGQYTWNAWLRERPGYPFGDIKDTISFAMAQNKRLKKLSDEGDKIEDVLNFIDKDHLEKSIDHV